MADPSARSTEIRDPQHSRLGTEPSSAALSAVLDSLDAERLGSWGRQVAALRRAGRRVSAIISEPSSSRSRPIVDALEADGAFIVLDAATATTDLTHEITESAQLGDPLLLIATIDHEENLLRAIDAGRAAGLTLWAITPDPSDPLTRRCDDVVLTRPNGRDATPHVLLAALLLCASSRLETAAPTIAVDVSNRAPIVVIGDTLLDRDLSGRVERISPEAPVPVVDNLAIHSRPGGAGLAALLAARSERPVILVTALAADREGDELIQLLEQHGVRIINLGLAGTTTVKTRVRSGNRTLLMLSYGPEEPLSPLRAMDEAEQSTVLTAAAVLVADYGRGITADRSVRTVLTEAAKQLPVVWDPHPRGSEPVPGVRLVTPNSREARHFAPGVSERGLRGDIDRARALTANWKAAGMAVTRGADGAVLLLNAADSSPLVVPTTSALEGDTCGAGDCFAAAATQLLSEGALLSEAVKGAVAAAERFVATGAVHASCADVTPDGLAENGNDDPLSLAERIRAQGGTVVATGGCFDILHTGHISLLAQARQLGDCLVVCLNDDDSVSRLKGPERPVVSTADRAALLNSLASVDGVLVFAEDTPEQALRNLRPDIYVKGGDYRLSDIPEAKLMESWGGQTVILPYLEGRSTTIMIDRIVGSNAAPWRSLSH